MTYVGCQDGSIRCVYPYGKDIALDNFIICKPHSDSVKKVGLGCFCDADHDGEEHGGVESRLFCRIR